ncbi:MAG: hypothetical protein QOJ56_2990 [Mycobacterium sp.]|nr:hypothetical protein [Mycobacterium sp.]
MFSALSALGRTQLIVRVDLALELVQHRFTCVGGSGGSILGVGPGFMGGDLRSQCAFNRGQRQTALIHKGSRFRT